MTAFVEMIRRQVLPGFSRNSLYRSWTEISTSNRNFCGVLSGVFAVVFDRRTETPINQEFTRCCLGEIDQAKSRNALSVSQFHSTPRARPEHKQKRPALLRGVWIGKRPPNHISYGAYNQRFIRKQTCGGVK